MTGDPLRAFAEDMAARYGKSRSPEFRWIAAQADLALAGTYGQQPSGLRCRHCNRPFNSQVGLSNHENRCPVLTKDRPHSELDRSEPCH